MKIRWLAKGTDGVNESGRLALSRDTRVLLGCVGAFCYGLLFLAFRGRVHDFATLYTAGGLIAEGHRAQLFDPQVQREFEHRVLGINGLLPYNHLGYEALLFALFALMPFKAALWLWRILSVGMLVLSSRMLADVFRIVEFDAFWLSLTFFPVAVTLVQGQDTLLTVLLFTSAITLMNQDRDRAAGILVALALYKPHMALPVALILIWRRGYRFLEGFLAGTSVVLLLTTLVTGVKGWQQMAEIWRYVVSNTGSTLWHAEAMPNLRGLIWQLRLGAQTTMLLNAVLSVALFVAAAWLLRHQKRADKIFAPAMALTLLIGTNVNPHDPSLLVIPIMAMIAAGKKSMALCVAAIYSAPLLMIIGNGALYALAIGVVLTMTISLSRQAETGMAVAPIAGKCAP